MLCRRGRQTQESWVSLIGPHQSGQVFLHSALRDEELPLGVHSRMLSLGWSAIPISCLTAVFPALGQAHFLYLEPWNFFCFEFYFIYILYSRFLLVIPFIHISVYMSIPISQFIPVPRFPPLVYILLFSTSVSLFLPCKLVHLYHYSRFHIYTLIYDICFFLSDLLHSL